MLDDITLLLQSQGISALGTREQADKVPLRVSYFPNSNLDTNVTIPQNRIHSFHALPLATVALKRRIPMLYLGYVTKEVALRSRSDFYSQDLPIIQ